MGPFALLDFVGIETTYYMGGFSATSIGGLNMAFENLLYEKRNGIGYVTINRPDKLNALNQKVMEELYECFQDIEKDNEVRAVILTGAGERAFVGGADINELAVQTPVEGKEMSVRGQKILDFIEHLGKPVIAAINGFALGGGCELAMACTLRIASENARLGQPEVKLGLIPGYAGTQRLPRLVGKGRALEMLLSGDPISASEAYRMGLVNQVVPAQDLIATAEKLAQKIMANAPLAVKFALEAVNHGLEMPRSRGPVPGGHPFRSMLYDGGHEGRHPSVPGEAAGKVYRQVAPLRKSKFETRKSIIEPIRVRFSSFEFRSSLVTRHLSLVTDHGFTQKIPRICHADALSMGDLRLHSRPGGRRPSSPTIGRMPRWRVLPATSSKAQ